MAQRAAVRRELQTGNGNGPPEQIIVPWSFCATGARVEGNQRGDSVLYGLTGVQITCADADKEIAVTPSNAENRTMRHLKVPADARQRPRGLFPSHCYFSVTDRVAARAF